MNLYIIRHAWAAERDDGQWPDDDLRPLTAEGKRGSLGWSMRWSSAA